MREGVGLHDRQREADLTTCVSCGVRVQDAALPAAHLALLRRYNNVTIPG